MNETIDKPGAAYPQPKTWRFFASSRLCGKGWARSTTKTRRNREKVSITGKILFSNTLGNFFRNLVLSDTHVFNPATVLDVKLGYHRNNLQVADSAPGGLDGVADFLKQTGIQGVPIKSTTVPLYPQVTVQGLFGVSQSGFPFPDDTYQALANLSRTQSRHFLKFGMDIRHMRNLDDGLFSGIFTFTKDPTADPQNVASTGQAIAAYLLGLPNMAQRNIGDTGPGGRAEVPALRETRGRTDDGKTCHEFFLAHFPGPSAASVFSVRE